jgi:protein involved in polysaccharide export with SLBB domain
VGSLAAFASATEIQQRLQLAISSEDYPVTPGDVYRLTYRQADTPITTDLLVENNNTINMKVFGTVNAAGMTFSELKPIIEKAVTNAYPRSMPSLAISSLGIFEVFLTGEIPQTRTIVAWGLSRLSEAVESRRGSDSSLRDIKVIAKDGTLRFYDLFKASRLGITAEDTYVKSGDTILLTRSERRVEIAGAVRLPGTYELLKDEQLRELVEFYGGGLAPSSDVARLRIERTSGERARIEYVSLEEGYSKGIVLHNGDIVTIPSAAANLPVVSFEGAVTQLAAAAAAPAVAPQEGGTAATPGYNRILYTFKEGETLSDAVRAVRGSIAPLADLSSASLIAADLCAARLSGADMTNCNCSWANLSEARLFGTCLFRACLQNANVCAADVRMADLRLADVAGVDWTDTDLTKVIWTEEDLWDDTRWE